MNAILKDQTVLTMDELATCARQVRRDAGDNQEETAAKLGVEQAQISRAENGKKSHYSICVRMIEYYTSYSLEWPLFRVLSSE